MTRQPGKDKGQGATEYLMTYGFAILVVIIVGIVLVQSGVFGTQTEGMSGFYKARVKEYQIIGNNISLILVNTAGTTLRGVNVTITGTCQPSSATVTPTPSVWAPGREYRVTATCASFTCTQGAGWVDDIVIRGVTESDFFFNDTGRIRGICG
jgi:hypothetical protein